MEATKKKFGLFSIILLGMNAIIGSGIFLLPGQAFDILGTSSLFVYLFITLLAGSMALCFAEVAGLFKSNGGAYIYAKEAFGNFAGFEVGFMKYIVQIIAWATMSVGFVTALSAIVPSVAEGPMRVVTIILVVGGLSIINILGLELAKYVNNIATVGKLVPLVLFIAVGIFFIDGRNFQPVIPEGITAGKFSESAILIFYAFTGFEAISTASEDMDNPKKNIPIAIAVSIGCVSLIYFMIQFVSIGILGTGLHGTKTPVVDAHGFHHSRKCGWNHCYSRNACIHWRDQRGIFFPDTARLPGAGTERDASSYCCEKDRKGNSGRSNFNYSRTGDSYCIIRYIYTAGSDQRYFKIYTVYSHLPFCHCIQTARHEIDIPYSFWIYDSGSGNDRKRMAPAECRWKETDHWTGRDDHYCTALFCDEKL